MASRKALDGFTELDCLVAETRLRVDHTRWVIVDTRHEVRQALDAAGTTDYATAGDRPMPHHVPVYRRIQQTKQ